MKNIIWVLSEWNNVTTHYYQTFCEAKSSVLGSVNTSVKW